VEIFIYFNDIIQVHHYIRVLFVRCAVIAAALVCYKSGFMHLFPCNSRMSLITFKADAGNEILMPWIVVSHNCMTGV